MKKTVILTAVFLLLQALMTFAVAGTAHHALFYPEEYQGRTVVFEKAKIGGPILKDPHTGFYGLNVQIGAKYTPGILYKSQLNFVVASPEMAEKPATHFNTA